MSKERFLSNKTSGRVDEKDNGSLRWVAARAEKESAEEAGETARGLLSARGLFSSLLGKKNSVRNNEEAKEMVDVESVQAKIELLLADTK